MSKKNKKQGQKLNNLSDKPSAYLGHAAEYKIIKHDLLKVLTLNLFYLAAVLAIYYTNIKSHYLENWFDKILHF